MWVPHNAAEIEEAAKRGDLEETPTFDAKADLPMPKKNASLAVDVAAMSTAGGGLLYGVGEGEHKRPTIPRPIPLAGAAERVAQIVSNSVSEVPYIDLREYPCGDDPSKGYLLVIVPASPRAPHQVTVGGDLRYYGRDAKGNRILTEGEVALLYRRREDWEQDRDVLLDEVIASAPIPPRTDMGYIHAFTRPVTLDQGLWERVSAKLGDQRAIHQALLTTLHGTRLGGQYGPSLESAAYWERRAADEWRLASLTERDDFTAPNVINSTVLLSVNFDGRGRLFCGRASDAYSGRPAPVIIEGVIAGNLEAFFAVMGMLYEVAEYQGHVDVGIALTGIGGAGSERRNRNRIGGAEYGYSASEFRQHRRVAAAELREPARVAHGLLRNFYEATSGIDGYNPFTDK